MFLELLERCVQNHCFFSYFSSILAHDRIMIVELWLGLATKCQMYSNLAGEFDLGDLLGKVHQVLRTSRGRGKKTIPWPSTVQTIPG